jgi:hypothetical protein
MDTSMKTTPLSAMRGFQTAVCVLGIAAAALVFPIQTLAQEESEPRLAQVLKVLSHEGLRLGMLLQVVGDPSIDGDDPVPASVQIAAARLRLEGDLDGGFNYKLQTNFAQSASLLDALVGWSTGHAFGLRAGRFKAPISSEFLTYAGAIDFVNRSRAVSELALGRQLGVQLNGRPSSLIHWSLSGFTGTESPAGGNPLVGVGRLEATPSWPEHHDTRITFAASAAVGRDGAVGTRAQGTDFEGEAVLGEADIRVESGRLLFAAEYLAANWDGPGGNEDAAGHYLTTGWMTGERTQLLARWDRYRPPGEESDDAILLGLNVWPTSASEIQVNWWAPVADDTSPHKVLVNFQIGF